MQRYDALDAATHDRQKIVDAVTDVECLGLFELPEAVGRYPTARYSHVQLKPSTGAKHQLRRHLKHIFHPIVGDTTYGDTRHNRFYRDKLDSRRLMLCASNLAFTHPITHKPIDVSGAPDADFQRVLTSLDQRNLYRQIATTQINAELIQAYHQTRYVIYPQGDDNHSSNSSVELTLNQRACLPDTLLPVNNDSELTSANRVAVFLTAHNPHSERLSDDANRDLHQQLLGDLASREIPWSKAVAKPNQSDWPDEEGVYVPDMNMAALTEFAQRYKQNAALVVRADCIPRLKLLK